MKKMGLFLFAFIFMANMAQAQITIDAMKFGTGVENNQIVGESNTFPNDVEKVYCWLKVLNGEGKTITLKWYNNDVFLSSVPLEITYNSMRTYGFKTIYGNGGNYKVDVVDEDGKVLQSGEFSVAGGSNAGAKSTSGSVSGVADGTVKVVDMKFGTGVENNEVVGEATTFDASVEAVYCWMRVTGGEGQQITVKWYFNNVAAGEVSLDINYNSMRTYSYKKINGQKGEWKAEIVGPSGVVMQTGTFTTN